MELEDSDSVDFPGSGDVFVYAGIENDPAQDEAFVFVAMDDQTFGLKP